MDPARGKLDQHEHSESRQAAWSPDLDREEVGRGEGVPVNGLGFRCQAATLHIGEPQPPRGELFTKDAVFFLEIVDDVALLLVDPPSNGDDEALQGLRTRKHTERAYQRWVATMKAAV